MADVFISYARADNAIARRLMDVLNKHGFKVFHDQEALVAGEDFSDSTRIKKELQNAQAVIVLLSRNSKRSKFVEAELREALEQGSGIIIPVLLDEEATENWIWPLVSNRQAIKVESPQDVSEVAEIIERSLARPKRSVLSSRSYWLIALFSIVSAIVTAIIVWLLK